MNKLKINEAKNKNNENIYQKKFKIWKISAYANLGAPMQILLSPLAASLALICITPSRPGAN